MIGLDLSDQGIGGMPRKPSWPRKTSGHKLNANDNYDAYAEAKQILAEAEEVLV